VPTLIGVIVIFVPFAAAAAAAPFMIIIHVQSDMAQNFASYATTRGFLCDWKVRMTTLATVKNSGTHTSNDEAAMFYY